MSKGKQNEGAEAPSNEPGAEAAAQEREQPKQADLAKAVSAAEEADAKIEPLVREKVAAGLTREQAVGVVRAQVKHDAKVAKRRKEAAAKKDAK